VLEKIEKCKNVHHEPKQKLPFRHGCGHIKKSCNFSWPYHNGIIHNVINVIYLQGSEGVFFTLVTQKSSKTFKLDWISLFSLSHP
jgi:hypothetical protein